MKHLLTTLRALTLPFHLLLGIVTGIIGMSVYWYYWTFKPNKLYTKYGTEKTN